MKPSVKKTAFMGTMLSLAIILIFLERMLPPLPMLPPQFSKIGLSNIIVMYIFFFVGKKEAFAMGALKAFFNLLLRGPVAGLLSLCGGLFSIAVMYLLWRLFKDKVSYVSLSVAGAVGHNAAQLFAACLLLQNWVLFMFYLPILLIAGAIFGTITGLSLRVIMPVFKKIHGGW